MNNIIQFSIDSKQVSFQFSKPFVNREAFINFLFHAMQESKGMKGIVFDYAIPSYKKGVYTHDSAIAISGGIDSLGLRAIFPDTPIFSIPLLGDSCSEQERQLIYQTTDNIIQTNINDFFHGFCSMFFALPSVAYGLSNTIYTGNTIESSTFPTEWTQGSLAYDHCFEDIKVINRVKGLTAIGTTLAALSAFSEDTIQSAIQTNLLVKRIFKRLVLMAVLAKQGKEIWFDDDQGFGGMFSMQISYAMAERYVKFVMPYCIKHLGIDVVEKYFLGIPKEIIELSTMNLDFYEKCHPAFLPVPGFDLYNELDVQEYLTVVNVVQGIKK